MRTVFIMATVWMAIGESVPFFRSPEEIWIVVGGEAAPRETLHIAGHHGGHPLLSSK